MSRWFKHRAASAARVPAFHFFTWNTRNIVKHAHYLSICVLINRNQLIINCFIFQDKTRGRDITHRHLTYTK